MILAVASCLSLAVGVSAANTTTRKATDFRDFDKSAWYAEAVSAAVDNGLLYGKSSTIIDPNGDMTRAEMAAIINRSFGCYKTADISQYKDVSKSKWYFDDIAMSVQMGTYNGRSSSSMAPDAPITREEAMTVVARALELDYDAYAKTDLSKFSDRDKISNWALPYVRAMVGADYIHGRTKGLEPLDNITRAEFAQIFANIIGTYITTKGSYDKDIKGNVLIRTDEVTLKDMTVSRSPPSFIDVLGVSFTDFLILGIVAVDIRTHDLEDLLCNAIKPARQLSVKIIVDCRFDCLRRVTLWHQGEHQRRFPVGHVPGRFVLLFLIHSYKKNTSVKSHS